MYAYSEDPNRIRETNPVFSYNFNNADHVECYRYNDEYDGDKYNDAALDGQSEIDWSELCALNNAVVVDFQLMNKDEYESTVMDGWTSSFTDYFEEEDLILVVLYATPGQESIEDRDIRLLREVLSKERKLK